MTRKCVIINLYLVIMEDFFLGINEHSQSTIKKSFTSTVNFHVKKMFSIKKIFQMIFLCPLYELAEVLKTSSNRAQCLASNQHVKPI